MLAAAANSSLGFASRAKRTAMEPASDPSTAFKVTICTELWYWNFSPGCVGLHIGSTCRRRSAVATARISVGSFTVTTPSKRSLWTRRRKLKAECMSNSSAEAVKVRASSKRHGHSCPLGIQQDPLELPADSFHVATFVSLQISPKLTRLHEPWPFHRLQMKSPTSPQQTLTFLTCAHLFLHPY